MLKLFKRFFPTNTSPTQKFDVEYYLPIGQVDENASTVNKILQHTAIVEEDSGVGIEDDAWDRIFDEYTYSIPPNMNQLNQDMHITNNPEELFFK